MINIANLPNKNEIYKHQRECRIRHYKNMELGRARLLLSELRLKKQKDDFIKRINSCKGYKFIEDR